MKKSISLLVLLFVVFMSAKAQYDDGFNTNKLQNDTIAQSKTDIELLNKNQTKGYKVAANIQDSLALVALYNSTDGPNWNNKTNWLTGNVADWYGITLDADGRCARIALRFNKLRGNIPSEFGVLTSLNELYLGLNSIGGSIPPEFENLTKLTTLRLEHNFLDSLPSEIGNLINLAYLDISKNRLSDLPDFSGLTNLYALYLYDNKLQFDDFEKANINWSSLIIDLNSSYSPQALIPLSKIESGDELTFSFISGGSNNSYQWYKNDVLINGTNQNSITINKNIGATYYCKISDSNFPNLVLQTTIGIVGDLVCGIISNQYNALIAFYDSTDGDNWVNNSNWKSSEPVENWYGITVNNYSVSQIHVANNNLKGIIPSEIGGVASLTRLDLKDNQLTGLSDLSGLANLFYLNIRDNKFQFDDLEIANVNWSSLWSYSDYSPQETIPLTKVESGDNVTFAFTCGGSNNQYQWYKNDVIILGKTQSSITVNYSEDNFYYCKIRNSNFFDLVLQTTTELAGSEICGIGAKEYNALLAFYNSTNGDSWKNKTNWISTESVEDWYGVIVENFHVIKIEIPNNNLTGNIPLEMGGMKNLSFLNLSENNIMGHIPSEIGNLINLRGLYLSNNKLTGNIPPEIGKLTNLNFLYLDNNQFTKLPDLSGIANLNYFHIYNNEFQFDDLINAGVSWRSSFYYKYSPQDTISLTRVENESDIVFNVDCGGLNNEYLWYKNNLPIVGEMQSFITVNYDDDAFYYCEIRDPNFTDLVLQTTTDIAARLTCGIFVSEYNALVAFYNSTNGDNWNDNTNWLSAKPVENWIGLTVENYHVSSIYLYNNNLTGNISGKIDQLTQLESLYLANNNLTELPDLSGLQKLNNVNISYNQFQFDDLENAGLVLIYPKIYSYSHQGNIPLTRVGNGSSITLSFTCGGSNNEYQWYKDDIPINGETKNSINVAKNEEGLYYCKISDSNFRALVLETTTEITGELIGGLFASNYNALVALYNSTNGDNWINSTNWRNSESDDTWYGVIVENYRVVGIDLSNNNLSGKIPVELADLTKLIFVFIENNECTSFPDLLLRDLLYLDVENNFFTFEDISPYMKKQLLYYRYGPQKPLLLDVNQISISSECRLSLDIIFLASKDFGGVGNIYQWFKDDAYVKTEGPHYVVDGTNRFDAGVYVCKMINPSIPGLVLASEELNIVFKENDDCLKLFPNPVINELYVKFCSDLQGEIFVSIINNMGAEVKRIGAQINSASEPFRVSINGLPNGFYTVKVIDSNQKQYVSNIIINK